MNSGPNEKLIFVYNADAGLRNAMLDTAHKIFSPSTYACRLCDITYGFFTENQKWKAFREKSKIEMEFLHKDEFAKTYRSKFGHKFTFPIVLLATLQGLDVFIGTEELNAMEDLEALTTTIEERL
ncbi:GTPase [Maribacter sp. 2-571]|uniref:GTPase n=1 Tax=Maribacter sp. 2-571 TaxID=3417569 RepID=UPI003D32987A